MVFPFFSKSTSNTVVVSLALCLFDVVKGQGLTVLNNTKTITGFPPCDALIAANLSHAVHLPSSPDFTSLVEASWALNTQKAPWCFVLPSTVSELSRTVIALRDIGDGAGDWHIAIRSGGHGSDNSNNIVDGVTIDLSQLNATTYDPETNLASIGTGARWGSVYESLQKDGVLVTGGREGIVGVGGFVLGGGNSFYTARTGFSCDSVVNYEVVLASGEIINANASANSDLWRALKGGGCNFGIVTRFDMEAFPAKNLTLESRIIGSEYSDKVIDAVAEFANLDQSWSDNAMLTLWAYDPEAGDVTITVIEANTVDDKNTTAFDAFNRVPALTPSTKQSLSLFDVANRSQVAEGTLNTGSYLTIANSQRIMRYCIQEHASLVADMKTFLGAQNFSTILDFQPLPSYYADIGAKKGGNMLGLEQNGPNKLFFTAGVTMLSESAQAQYPEVQQQVTAMFQRIEAFAKSVGGAEEWVYMNYAHANQDPLGSYGAENVQHIRRVARQYDPEAFFQLRVPGGFKIDRVDAQDVRSADQ